ncbi:MAG: cytochrome c oxidase subunit III [Saprospiraceae bacterium]|nr:cytochrome c oxidase subunit III [Saprospiraceae bacterium]
MSADRQRQTFAIHPYRIFVFLIIAAISVLFMSLTISYGYTRFEKGIDAIPVPPIFLINTLLLVASSFCLVKAKKSYRNDAADPLKTLLLWTILLSFVFMISQIFGWLQLFENNLPVGLNNGVSYLYLISGVHFAHILVGLPFLISFYLGARKSVVEPVSELLYFTDPEKKVKLDLLTIYWHFLDILWIYLVVFFAINSII